MRQSMTDKAYKRLTLGEMILHFIEDTGVTQYQLAKNAGIAHSRLADIIKNRCSISADTALRLGEAFGNSAEFWMNLQKNHELAKTREKDGEHIQAEVVRLAS
jgi:addiction module HigA family antidote